MERMPQTNWENIVEILEIEKKFRSSISNNSTIPNLEALQINEYWKNILHIVFIKGCLEHGVSYTIPSSLNINLDGFTI